MPISKWINISLVVLFAVIIPVEANATGTLSVMDSLDFQNDTTHIISETIQSTNTPSSSFTTTVEDSLNLGLDDTLTHRTIQSIELYIDYLKLMGMAFPSQKKAEMGVKILTGIYLGLFFEGGYALITPEDYIYNGAYEVTGYYGRLGVSYNYEFLPNANFYAGLSYAQSRYEDEATIQIQSSLWDDYNQKYTRQSLEAQWAEVILGSESRWKGNFYLGFMVRLRLMISNDNFTPIEVYTIPGYGRSFSKAVPALNLYIKYRIGF